ncbi:MAG: DUF927 domain-containing protein [Clostridia bacterium]|jgi:uncharacterized protein (DUF927 family)|nr:DUF927 domain-containing protein [Clostridia bacterium]
MTTFFEALYSNCENGWVSTWTLQDKRTMWHPVKSHEQALEHALKLTKEKAYDIYFGVGLRKKNLGQWKRGNSETVITIPALWVDIDIAGESHKKTSLPPTLEAAIKLIKEFPLLPSALIHSGYGLHGYWILKEPWEFESNDERQEAQILLKSLEQTIRYYAGQKGWDIDPTADLARVLRIPGTYNYKQKEAKKVEILELNDNRYNPSEFEEYLIDQQLSMDLKQPSKGEQSTSVAKKNGKAAANAKLPFAYNRPDSIGDAEDYDYGPAALILENCYFIKHCQKHPTTLSEPEWYAMVSNVARGEGGMELVHELSSPYPGYSHKETDRKIEHALNNGYPHTCEYIQNELGFDCPEAGAMCTVTAPVGHCLSILSGAKSKTKSINKDNAFSPEIIGALAVLKKDDPISYANIKQELKGKVNLNDMEKAVKHQMMKNQKLRLIKEQEQTQTLDDVMPNIPLKNLRLPYQWSFSENGIWQMKKVKAGETEGICACPVPVILTKRLRNIDSGEEKIELAYYRDKRWHHITAPRATVFNRQGLIQLGNRGLPVSSENARYLIDFLFDLERENLNVLPLQQSLSRMGWISSTKFIPGSHDGIELDADGGTGEATLAHGYRESGTLTDWINDIKPLLKYPIARFMLAASFAGPMLKIFNQRVYFIHNWGPSRGGKTAALKAALSVWGEPEVIMANFNSTRVGLERLAAFYSDLPLGVDERQVVGDKQGLIESLVYMLGMGKGKTRGSKGGGTQKMNFWRTIVLTTGEQPLSSDSSSTGIKTRVAEIYGLPIPDENLARKTHDTTKENFGTAGVAFIKRLIQEATNNMDEIKEYYTKTKEAIAVHFADNVSSHIDLVTATCLADYYANQWIFDKDENTAAKEAAALAETILSYLESALESDESNRAYEYIISWYYVHKSYFGGDAREQYGHTDGNKLYVYPTAFDKAMKEGGFSSTRILRDWAEQGIIDTETRANKKRFKVRKWDPETQSQKYYVALKLQVT